MDLIVQNTRDHSPTLQELTKIVYGGDGLERQGNLRMLLDLLRRHYNYNVRHDRATDKIVFSHEPYVSKGRKQKPIKKQQTVPEQPVNIDALNIINQRIQALRRMSQLFTEPQRVGVFISEVDNLIIKLLTK